MLLYFVQNVFFKSKIILLCVIIAIQHSSSSKTSARKTQLAKQNRGRKRPLRKTRCRKFPVNLVLINITKFAFSKLVPLKVSTNLKNKHEIATLFKVQKTFNDL